MAFLAFTFDKGVRLEVIRKGGVVKLMGKG